MKKYIFYTILLFLFSTNISKAQHNLILHNFDGIHQSLKTNPASFPKTRFALGLPVLSSTYFSFYNTFKPKDILTERVADDSLDINIPNLLKNMTDNSFMSFSSTIDLFTLGFKVKRFYFTMDASTNIDFMFLYPKDLLEFAYYGNGSPEILNKQLNFGNVGVNFNSYLDLGFGVAFKATDRLTVGAKYKYLKGIGNIEISDLNINMITKTDPNTIYSLNADMDYVINIAGLPIDDLNNIDQNEMINAFTDSKSNNGMAVDVGANFKLTEQINLTASLIDLGYINWNTYTYNLTGNVKEISFSGLDYDIKDTSSIFSGLSDSILNSLSMDTTNNSYRGALKTKYYFGGSFDLNDKNIVSLLFYGLFYKNDFVPAYSIGFTKHIGRFLSFKANYSIIENNFDNVGVGMALRGGPFQFYLISDNILPAFKPMSTNHLSFRFGLNFVVAPKKNKTKDEAPSL